MIARAASFVALLYLLGFIFFSLSLGKPAAPDAPRTAEPYRE